MVNEFVLLVVLASMLVELNCDQTVMKTHNHSYDKNVICLLQSDIKYSGLCVTVRDEDQNSIYFSRGINSYVSDGNQVY